LIAHPRVAKIGLGRCEELCCPLLALKVFGNHSKYGMSLSLLAARQLLHSLQAKHPLQNVITAAALYPVHNLPAISTDIISCSMLISVCFTHNTEDSIRVAEALVPHLQTLLSGTEPQPVSLVPAKLALDKPKIWLMQSLANIEQVLKDRNDETEWLRVWRRRSGHADVDNL
jgi:hypothetical protein